MLGERQFCSLTLRRTLYIVVKQKMRFELGRRHPKLPGLGGDPCYFSEKFPFLNPPTIPSSSRHQLLSIPRGSVWAITLAMRLSGLQREVLALYRKCLRESRKKPSVRIRQLAFRSLTSNFLYRMSRLISSPSQGQSSHFLLVFDLYIEAATCFDRREFDKSIALDKKDFGAIEYLLRKGQRQLEMYSSPGIRDVR
jgi:succinate dehydrogenase assembly factor 1